MKKIFVIGDSISIHYGPELKKALSGYCKYDRKRDNGQSLQDLDNPVGANGGDSKMVLDYLKELKKEKLFNFDYLVLNCGLHDIKTSKTSGIKQVSLENYSKNLQEIVAICKSEKIKVIWINTTPVFDEIHNKRASFNRYNQDVLDYNNEAYHIMRKEKIPVIDLYSFTYSFLPQGYIDHVHFNTTIRAEQAKFIASQIIKII